MRRMFKRRLTIGLSVGVAAAVACGVALATVEGGASVHRVGLRSGGFVGVGPGGGGFLGQGPGNGRSGFGFAGPGMRLGAGGLGGGIGVLGANVLAPAASFLNVSLGTLESDLAGGKTLAQVATGANLKPTDLITAIVNSEQTVLDAEKAAGWITSNQESALVSAFTSEVTNLVNNGPAVPRTGAPVQGGLLQTAATFLNVPLSQLQSDLQSGKTLADVATAQGKQVSDLVSALEAPTKTKLDATVSAGTITAAQETTILSNLTTRLNAIVNGTAGGGRGFVGGMPFAAA